MRLAAGGMTGSTRRIARALADRVATMAMQDTLDDADAELTAALARAEAAWKPTPAHTLALSAEIDVAGMIQAERAKRFAGRGFRQIEPAAWTVEGREITALIARRLAQRYERILRK